MTYDAVVMVVGSMNLAFYLSLHAKQISQNY